jgi:hypothetical protein
LFNALNSNAVLGEGTGLYHPAQPLLAWAHRPELHLPLQRSGKEGRRTAFFSAAHSARDAAEVLGRFKGWAGHRFEQEIRRSGGRNNLLTFTALFMAVVPASAPVRRQPGTGTQSGTQRRAAALRRPRSR